MAQGQFVSLVCPQSTCQQSFSTGPITLLIASLSYLLWGSNLLTSRALNTPSSVPMKHSALLLLTPSHTPNLYRGFGLFNSSEDDVRANTFSPNGTNYCVGLDLSDTCTRCCLHFPPAMARWGSLLEVIHECSSPWHLMVLMMPRNSITPFSTNPFQGLSPFTASSVVIFYRRWIIGRHLVTCKSNAPQTSQPAPERETHVLEVPLHVVREWRVPISTGCTGKFQP